jgi:heme-degrading monooxygenase HmoA
MVITILEAHVPSDQWNALEKAFKSAAANLEPGIVQTFLVHSTVDSTLWRIMTVWESRAALDQMRRSNETPRGVLIFREAKAEPTLSVFDVAARSAGGL